MGLLSLPVQLQHLLRVAGDNGEAQLGVPWPDENDDVGAGLDVLRHADQVLGLTEHRGVVVVLHLNDRLGLVGVVVSPSPPSPGSPRPGR